MALAEIHRAGGLEPAWDAACYASILTPDSYRAGSPAQSRDAVSRPLRRRHRSICGTKGRSVAALRFCDTVFSPATGWSS